MLGQQPLAVPTLDDVDSPLDLTYERVRHTYTVEDYFRPAKRGGRLNGDGQYGRQLLWY